MIMIIINLFILDFKTILSLFYRMLEVNALDICCFIIYDRRMLLRIFPLILSCLMMSAHFYRHFNYPLMAISLLVPFLLLIKKRWALYVIQVLALAGAGVWVNTIVVIADARISYGTPWIRMAVILGAIAIFTLCSGLLMNLKKIKEKYK